MIARMTRNDIAVLILHMQIMRKTVKRGFKSNKEVIETFDDTKEILFESIEPLEEAAEETDVHFNIKNVDILHSFLSWYVPELDKTFSKAGKDAKKEDIEQFETLRSVHTNISKVKELHV